MSDDDSDDFKDPALKHFNRTSFVAQHVVKETAMGGVMGAVAGAVVGAVFVMAVVALGLAAAGPIGMILGSLGVVTGTAATLTAPVILGAAITGATWGGGIGALVKGMLGMSGANEAADAEEERLISKSEANQNRVQRLSLLEQNRDMQKLAMDRQTQMIRGANPNQGLPRMGSAELGAV